MGLDSIELVMDIEKYFGIQIPDSEAEKIYTVQDMVDVAASHLDITSADMPLRNKIFLAVISSFQKFANGDIAVQLTDKVSDFLLSHEKQKWEALENSLGLNVPKPDIYNPSSKKLSDRFKKLINWTPNYDWYKISFERFIDSICASNYQKLLDQTSLKNKYEVYVGVMGITVDKIGVDYFEISPDKSFTADLGVD